MHDRKGWLQTVAYLAMLAAIVVVVISVCLPNTSLPWMRDNISLFNWPMVRIENAHSPVNLVHLILFVVFGACVGMGRPGWHAGCVLLAVTVFAIGSELLQVEIPGRHPRIADAIVDIVGAVVGLLFVYVIRVLVSRLDGSTTAMADVDDPGRETCIALLRGDDSGASALGDLAPETLLASAQREGVVSLIAERLNSVNITSPAVDSHRQIFAEPARREAARNLWCQAQCRAITSALSEAGIDAIWMKGAALSQWLYPRPNLRDLADIDLLLPDHATTLRAAEVLAPLGYVLPNPYIAGDLVVHELLAWSDRAQLELDLHWRLSNDVLFAERMQWQELREGSIKLSALGTTARGLAPAHAFLHACMHRALNTLTGGENRLRWLYDIQLLATHLTCAEWEQVRKLALNRGLGSACHDGLLATIATFNTPVPESVLDDVAAAAAREWLECSRLKYWVYFQRATWRSLPDTPTRLHWLRQLLFPDVAHLRVRYGDDDAGFGRILLRRVLDGLRRLGWYIAK